MYDVNFMGLNAGRFTLPQILSTDLIRSTDTTYICLHMIRCIYVEMIINA